MNICCLNVSSKMCVKFATATLEQYPRIQRLVSPRIATEHKNHLAIARPYNEANTVEFDQGGT